MSPSKSQKSRCSYCGSSDYGKGCRFGPHGVHFHPSNSLKCSYCGSGDYGKGCRLNPTSNLHVHGAEYNSMYKESVQSFLENSVLIEFLKRDYTSFECYKLGIIDATGNKIKEPITEQEINSYSPFVKTILRIKRYLGSKVELLNATNALNKNKITVNEDLLQYKKVLEFRDKIDGIVNELYKTLDEAIQSGLPLEEVKNLINA